MGSVPITSLPVVNPGGNPNANLPARLVMLAKAGKAHGVPLWILWGVYGIETGWGANVKTSSAGAKGHMQFTEATARQWKYPYTNTPNAQQLAQQFDSAAAYLAYLKKQKGTWDGAIHGYSAGPDNKDPKAGYGLKEVEAKAKEGKDVTEGKVISTPVDDAPEKVADAAKAAFDGTKAIGAFFATLLEGDTWLRVLKVGGGGVFLYIALRELGAIPAASTVAAKAAKATPTGRAGSVVSKVKPT